MTRRPQPQTPTVNSATLGSDCCTSGLWRSSAWSFQLHHGRLAHRLHHQAAALLRLKLPRAGVLSQDNGQMSKRETCPLSLRLAPLRRLRVTAYELCSVTPCDRISMIHCHRHPRYRHPLRRLVHKVVSVDQVQPSSSAAF